MATRHQVRQSVISLLYAREMGDKSAETIDEFLENKKIRNDQKKFTLDLFEGVLANVDFIDDLLNSHLGKWKLEEIGFLEREILRLGAYELEFTSTDAKIIISEAIALASEFSSETSIKLINAVLDAISKDKM